MFWSIDILLSVDKTKHMVISAVQRLCVKADISTHTTALGEYKKSCLSPDKDSFTTPETWQIIIR